MFVPVHCTQCGKPFQVPESALGQLAPCPWCGATVTALPVSAPVAVPESPAAEQSQTASPASEPLSLDDAEPVASANTNPKPAARPVAKPRRDAVKRDRAPAAPPPPAAPVSVLGIVMGVVAVAVVVVVVMGATIVFLNYGSGRVPESGWTEFAPGDGSFSILLPGVPQEEEVAGNPGGSIRDGKRFTVSGWYSKTDVWVAYHDLDPAVAKGLAADKDRVIAAGVLRAERDRELKRLEGTLTKEAEVRINSAWGIELHVDTPRGEAVEWLLVSGDGPRPRLYAFGVRGKGVTPESPSCRKLFTSFRIND